MISAGHRRYKLGFHVLIFFFVSPYDRARWSPGSFPPPDRVDGNHRRSRPGILLINLTFKLFWEQFFFVKLCSSTEPTFADILLISDGSQVRFANRGEEGREDDGEEGERAKAREEQHKSCSRRPRNIFLKRQFSGRNPESGLQTLLPTPQLISLHTAQYSWPSLILPIITLV